MYSLLVHEIVLLGVLAASIWIVPKAKPRPPELVGMINVREHRDIIYFPAIVHESPPAPAVKSPGFSYPGPQTIISDVPETTNRILTVLQPAIQNPPILKPPLLLPNIVQLPPATAVPRLQIPLPIVKAPPAPVAPALPVPVVKSSPPPVEEQPLVVPEVKVPAAPLKAVDVPLLALSPMPATRVQPAEVPAGEARGRFAISPEPNLAANDPEPGIAKLPPTPAANANTSVNKSEPFSGITILGGSSAGGNSAGNSSSIITLPTSDSSTARSGSGIVSLGPSPPPVTGSYGVTVVSTESSGGGLPNFGVFSDDTKYTVFLDMKTASGTAQSWTLEFGVPRNLNSNGSSGNHQGFVLPFPVVKEPPLLPAELVQRYLRRLVIVYGIISADGKMQQLAVKDSPDAGLNEAVLNALGKWSFRPAQLDGQAVAVKVLIGIPLSP